MTLNKPNLSSKSIENSGDCKIDETIALYEELQFVILMMIMVITMMKWKIYKTGWKMSVGVEGTPYHWA